MASDGKPHSLGPVEVQTLRTIWLGNLITFSLVVGGSFLVAGWRSAVSVLVGGLIALVNFRLLQRNVSQCILPREKGKVLGRMLFKYYLRFGATALILLILVREGLVEPLGLLVGLSVVVVTVMIWGALEARKMTKEAI